MKFLNNQLPSYDLTFSDVFMVPSLSNVGSRMNVDLKTTDGINANIPIVVSNMNAVSGKRMAETIARRGGIAILPQDMPVDELKKTIDYVKSRHLVYETPITLTSEQRIGDAMALIHKRAHSAVIIVDNKNKPIGVFTESDAKNQDRFTQLSEVMSTELLTFKNSQSLRSIYEKLNEKHLDIGPIVSPSGKLIGLVTKKGILRSGIFEPLVDKNGRLKVGVAIGINGDVAAKARQAIKFGADVLVIDTAHGHQDKMIEALKIIRSLKPKIPVAAGNVVTKQAVNDLIEAGADIVKVGIGPGAMCTTRMMTGVGRPQFSAVLECAEAARAAGKKIWADGGIRYPRDVALALAGGAHSVMIGSWFAGTFESVSDIYSDPSGRLYKENYGMASKRAVSGRSAAEAKFIMAQKELFDEGISTSRMYLNPLTPGVEDIVDSIVAGLRSSMTYAGAKNLEEFYEKAVVGIQSGAGFSEGRALDSSWD